MQATRNTIHVVASFIEMIWGKREGVVYRKTCRMSACPFQSLGKGQHIWNVLPVSGNYIFLNLPTWCKQHAFHEQTFNWIHNGEIQHDVLHLATFTKVRNLQSYNIVLVLHPATHAKMFVHCLTTWVQVQQSPASQLDHLLKQKCKW